MNHWIKILEEKYSGVSLKHLIAVVLAGLLKSLRFTDHR